jgi:hypothetical protein
MKKDLLKFSVLMMVAALIATTSCKKKDDDEDDDPAPTSQTITVSGHITTNTTWTANNKYVLSGFVYVDSLVTLTIEPGTIIKGEKATKGSLIIKRGAKIMAQGTVTKPIIFTSDQAAGSRNYGDWGGLIICGSANINVAGSNATIEGGVDAQYGGTNNADNSGVLQYVRIEFPGIPFLPDKEINGLTMGGVGSGTTIDHIQISFSGDDSDEWFGGKVNARYIVAYRGWDDDFDTDYGYTGKVQFAISLRDSSVADPGSGSNSFESDNDGSGSSNTPFTQPVFCNVSVYGPKVTTTTAINSNFKRSMHLRRNSKISIFNSVFCGFPTGLFIDGSAAQANATADELRIENSYIAGMGTFFASSFERTYFLDAARNNDTLATNNLLMVTNPFVYASPNFLPAAGSPLLSGASFTDSYLSDSFFMSVSYVGAMGTSDWTTGWCNWDPQNTAY